jgi:hypothetical protein
MAKDFDTGSPRQVSFKSAAGLSVRFDHADVIYIAPTRPSRTLAWVMERHRDDLALWATGHISDVRDTRQLPWLHVHVGHR